MLMATGRRSTSGRPLMVGGPQIGYFYPGLMLEMDLKGPGWQARGATAAPFPGYMLIGRGEDFAWSLTSAGRGHHRPLRRDAVRRQQDQVRLQGPVSRHDVLRRGPAGRRQRGAGPPGHLQQDRARAGGRLRDRERARGGDLAQALELRPRHRRSAALSRPHQGQGPLGSELLQGRQPDAADVQLLLHRPQEHRDVHLRAAPDPPQEHRLRPARGRPRAATSGAASSQLRSTRRGSTPRTG